jgi:hypothetical protein
MYLCFLNANLNIIKLIFLPLYLQEMIYHRTVISYKRLLLQVIYTVSTSTYLMLYLDADTSRSCRSNLVDAPLNNTHLRRYPC